MFILESTFKAAACGYESRLNMGIGAVTDHPNVMANKNSTTEKSKIIHK